MCRACGGQGLLAIMEVEIEETVLDGRTIYSSRCSKVKSRGEIGYVSFIGLLPVPRGVIRCPGCAF